MNRSSKLLLTAIVFVGGAMALAFVLQPNTQKEELPAPKRARGSRIQQLAELQPAPEDMPKAARAVETYLKGRWSQFDDEGIVAAGVEGGGKQFFVSKDAIVGRGGDGRLLYARSIMQVHKYEGPVFTYKNSPLKVTAAAQVSGGLKGNAVKRLPKGKAGKIPLDQVPGGDWGELSKIPTHKD